MQHETNMRRTVALVEAQQFATQFDFVLPIDRERDERSSAARAVCVLDRASGSAVVTALLVEGWLDCRRCGSSDGAGDELCCVCHQPLAMMPRLHRTSSLSQSFVVLSFSLLTQYDFGLRAMEPSENFISCANNSVTLFDSLLHKTTTLQQQYKCKIKTILHCTYQLVQNNASFIPNRIKFSTTRK